LAERAFEGSEEGFVADFPAEHVEGHGAFFKRGGLELWREGVQAAVAGEGDGVIGQRTGCYILQGGVHGVFTVLVFDIHQLAVAGHTVGDPCVIEGARADLRTPPLVGDCVGQEADAALIGNAGAEDGSQLRGPDGGECIVRQLNDIEVRGFSDAEIVGKEVVLFGGGLSELGSALLVRDGEINLDVAGAGGDGIDVAAGDDRAGEAGFVPFEVELVAGLAVGQGDGLAAALRAAGEDPHALGNAEMDLSGEAVGEVAVHGKPAGWVEQVGDGLLDGS
jgi:hypothetical protein